VTTEKLRDAVAALVFDAIPGDPGPDGWPIAQRKADAILALPEMVAAMAVVEAARAWRHGYVTADGYHFRAQTMVTVVDKFEAAMES
jgi:hypothetical protein